MLSTSFCSSLSCGKLGVRRNVATHMVAGMMKSMGLGVLEVISTSMELLLSVAQRCLR